MGERRPTHSVSHRISFCHCVSAHPASEDWFLTRRDQRFQPLSGRHRLGGCLRTQKNQDPVVIGILYESFDGSRVPVGLSITKQIHGIRSTPKRRPHPVQSLPTLI